MNTFSKCSVIFDEVDWFAEKPVRAYQFKNGDNNCSRLVAITRAVSSARHFIGLTGSMSSRSLKIWKTALFDVKHKVFDFNTGDFKPPKITTLVKYDKDRRGEEVKNYVYDILVNDVSVIVIDDYNPKTPKIPVYDSNPG